MQKGKYGNYIIYYDDRFVLYLYHKIDNKVDPEQIKKRAEHGFVKAFSDGPETGVFMYRPAIKNGRVQLEYGFAFSKDNYKFNFVFTTKKNIINCISGAKTLDEVYGEKGIKCGNRRLKRLFGNYIIIENLSPVAAHFEGLYREYTVKGLSLGHTYFEYAPHYLMSDDKTYVASENSPRITYSFIKKFRKDFPNEELVGFVKSPLSSVPSKMKVRVNNGDYTIDVIINKNILVPKLTDKGIEFTEAPPTEYEKAVKNVEKILDELNAKPRRVLIGKYGMTIKTRYDTVVITPKIIKVIGGPTFENNIETAQILSLLSNYPASFAL